MEAHIAQIEFFKGSTVLYDTQPAKYWGTTFQQFFLSFFFYEKRLKVRKSLTELETVKIYSNLNER